MHITLALIFQLVLLAFVALCCLLGYGYPQYSTRTTSGRGYILWFILGIAAIVVGVLLIIQS